MDCRECRDKLSLYLDGQLTDSERVRVEAEIDSCADCAGEFERLSLLVEDLNAIGPAEAPEALLEDLRMAFHAELAAPPSKADRPAGFWSHFGLWRGLAASLLLALTLVVIARDRGLFDRDLAPRERASNEEQSEGRSTRPGNDMISPSEASMEKSEDKWGVAGQPAGEVTNEDEASSETSDADDPLAVESEREVRHLGAWRGFLDHVGSEVRKRGLDLVESRAETEDYLNRFGSEPTAPTAEKIRPARGRRGDVKGLMKGGVGSVQQDMGDPDPKGAASETPRRPARSYFLVGEGAVRALEDEARALDLELRLSPIVRLDSAAKTVERAGAEAQLELTAAETEALVARLAARPGLGLRLFARSESPASRPSGTPASPKKEEPKLLLLFILPRP